MALAPLADVPNVEWTSLAFGRYTSWTKHWLTDPDWEATAQVIENLDLVVSCDTAIAHLSASLGRPTWLLLPLRADWKYGPSLCFNYLASDLEQWESSIWYPKVARIFRQSDPVDWGPTIAEVARLLTSTAKDRLVLEQQSVTADN